MIIVSVSGGLGNQMFQYAFGQSLQKRKNIEVKYKLNFDGLVNRKFELDNFNISGKLIGDEEFGSFWRDKEGVITKTRNRFSRYYKKSIVREQHYHYDSNLFSVPSNCMIEGHFQSEKYFIDIASDIRTEFSFKTPLGGENAIQAESIKKTNSVSLHIRRGDYLKIPLFPVYGLEYYQKAINWILQVVTEPVFYIFSNDHDWCRKNIPIDNPTYFVSHNTEENPYFDLYLMSLCKHNIIANSSFSWWAAWLNTNTNKRIIAPYPWVNKTSRLFNNIEDVIPARWTTIKMR